jgi:hypothetical protein
VTKGSGTGGTNATTVAGGTNATTAGGTNATTTGGTNATTVAGGTNATTSGGANATTAAGGTNATTSGGANATTSAGGTNATTAAAGTNATTAGGTNATPTPSPTSLGSAIIKKYESELLAPSPGASPGVYKEFEKIKNEDTKTYKELEKVVKSPGGESTLSKAANENPSLYNSKTENDIIQAESDIVTAEEELNKPGALNDAKTKELLQKIVDNNVINDDIETINTGIKKVLIPTNKNNPEYETISNDYKTLKSLDAELKRERIALQLAVNSGNVPQIQIELKKIKETEEQINATKNKMELDLVKFYRHEPEKTNQRGGGLKYKITRPDSIMILI